MDLSGLIKVGTCGGMFRSITWACHLGQHKFRVNHGLTIGKELNKPQTIRKLSKEKESRLRGDSNIS